MIDTDKYKGHLAHLEYELWAFTDFMDINATHKERRATYALLNDAPLLLEEVKRLREMVMLLDARLGTIHNHILGMEDWEQVQASILAECRGEVPHEIHPYPPLDMKNNR